MRKDKTIVYFLAKLTPDKSKEINLGNYTIETIIIGTQHQFSGAVNAFTQISGDINPLGRNANPTDTAPTVALLLSEGAAYMNGVNILITGGELL